MAICCHNFHLKVANAYGSLSHVPHGTAILATGRERILIRSHSSARFCLPKELSGNSNYRYGTRLICPDLLSQFVPLIIHLKVCAEMHFRESFSCTTYHSSTGRERLIRSHSSARFCFELSGNSNYRSDTVNSNTVNSKFHFIRSYYEIFSYHFPIISCLKCMVNSNFHLIRSKTLPTNDFELTVPNL